MTDDDRIAWVEIAKLKATALRLATSVADDFRDNSGASLPYTETTQSLPAMTAPTAPSGHVASSSSRYQGSAEDNTTYGSYLAFDQTSNFGIAWYSDNQSAPWWLQRRVPSAIFVNRYALVPRSSLDAIPTEWSLLGSNDGSTWTILDTRTGITWPTATLQSFAVATPGSYTFYRLNITKAGGGATSGYVSVAELQLFQGATGTSTNATYDAANNLITNIVSGSPAPLDLQSVAFPASAVPTKGSLFLLAKVTAGSLTLNTNLTAQISRDGGTTWAAVTLQSLGTLPNGYTIFEVNNADISAQPSGSSMKYRIRTTGTTLGIAIDAVVFSWG